MFVDEGSAPSVGEGLAETAVEAGSDVAPSPCLEAISDDDLERELCVLAAQINVATCHWLLLAAEFDRRGAHEAFGFVSCASWLAWRCSITPRAAREQLRVARALEELPAVTAAFRSGRLSYSKVRAITRAGAPELEAELLELATEATAAQLERIVRGYRRATAPEDSDDGFERHLSLVWQDDGSLAVRGRLAADEGELLIKALEVATEAIGADEEGRAASRADALVGLAESAIAGGVSEATGGERHQLVVHWDVGSGEGGRGAGGLGASDGGGSNGGSRAQLESGTGICETTLKRIGCDASVVAMVERDGTPLSVGRKTRSIPPALARALSSRDGGCRFPGCGRSRFVDAHHIHHWADGGETSLDNLIQLCRTHHRLLHEGGYSVERTGEELRFRTPRGHLLEAVPRLPQGSVARCVATAIDRDRGGPGESVIDAESIAPGSWGAPFDLGLTVSLLAMKEE